MGASATGDDAPTGLSTTTGETGLYPETGKGAKSSTRVPTVIDRALQRTVRKVLESIYEQDFCSSSFGGRPKRGAHYALATLNEVICSKRVNWVYEADLKSFFTSLNHEWVERFLSHRVVDPKIATLIKRWLKAGVIEQGGNYSAAYLQKKHNK